MTNPFVVMPAAMGAPTVEDIQRQLGLLPYEPVTDPLEQVPHGNHTAGYSPTDANQNPLFAPEPTVMGDTAPGFYAPEPVNVMPIQQPSLPLDPHPDNHQHIHHAPEHEAPEHELMEDDQGTDAPPGVYFSIMPEWYFAKMMGFTLQTIAAWRKAGKGPNYTMIGKQIFYQEKEISAWLDRHTHASGT